MTAHSCHRIGVDRPYPEPAVWSVLDRLDYEDNDKVRAELIDEGCAIADACDACAVDWANR